MSSSSRLLPTTVQEELWNFERDNRKIWRDEWNRTFCRSILICLAIILLAVFILYLIYGHPDANVGFCSGEVRPPICDQVHGEASQPAMQLLLTILLIGLLTYETTSLAGYLFQLLVLCRCGEFSNAYYGIVRYSAVMDLFIFFSDWLTRRSLSLPVLEPLMRRLYSLFPHANIALVVQTFCFHVLMAPAIFSAVQSICILASPIIADVKFRAVVPKFFGLVVVYGLALSLPLFATHPDLVETADRLFFHWESIQESSLTLLINFFIAIGYLVIMIVLIFIFGFYLHEYWKERLVRLCLLSFFICVSRTFVLVLMTCNFLNTHLSLGWEPVLDPLLTVSLDITLLASPWLHLAFNRAFQRRVAWILGIKTENRIHVTNTVTQQQNPSASMYKY